MSNNSVKWTMECSCSEKFDYGSSDLIDHAVKYDHNKFTLRLDTRVESK